MKNSRLRQLLFGFGLIIVVAAVFIGLKAAARRSAAPVVRWPAVPHEEPVYQGKPLSYWVIRAGDIGLNGAHQDAIEAIRAIGSNAVPFLLDWMPHYETTRRSGLSEVQASGGIDIAWWALGTEGRSAIPHLASILNQPQRTRDDYSVWTKSAIAISYLGPEAITPMLTAATNMQGQHEVWELIHNFGNLGTNGAPAVSALIQWAQDPDYFVRDGVVSALGNIGQRPDLALPVILNALEHDSDGMVRRDAAEALGCFARDSEAVLPELVKRLKDPNWEVRQGAVSGLGKIGDKPDIVIPLLVPFLSDQNSVIERSAAYALLELNCRTAYKALAEHENPNIGDIVYQASEQEKARQRRFK